MKNNLFSIIKAGIFLAFFILGNSVLAEEKVSLFVSIPPQRFFLRQLTDNMFEINVMVGPGMSPATYEPLPQQMAKLSRAKIFFSIGLPFEKGLLKKMKSVAPAVKIVATDAGIKKRMMTAGEEYEHEGAGHVHGKNCRHEAGTPDPHIWLDPDLVKIQADNMAGALMETFPDKAEIIRKNLVKFKEKLTSLSEEIVKTFEPFRGKTILVFHPAFGYFTDKAGLIQKAIEIEGKDPSPRQMVEIIREAKAENVKIIFVQKQFSSRAAETIARSVDGMVIAVDPLEEDYFACIDKLTKAFTESLQK
ncbi:MAG: zinc ABC transporter substrate-binding protein [Candidatus Rifleibacteriota bacterium]